LRVHKPELDGLNKLLHVCNTAVEEYGQPPLYAKASTTAATGGNTAKGVKGPRKKTSRKVSNADSSKAYWSNLQDVSAAFHISIAWTLGSPSQDLVTLTKSIGTNHFKDVSQTRVNIQEIKAKVGNIVTNMPLHTNIQEAKELFSF
jgi:U6 snRNA phosphodiesterase